MGIGFTLIVWKKDITLAGKVFYLYPLFFHQRLHLMGMDL